MAITRTQIAKQLLANGGRIGFRVGTGEGKDTSGRDYGGSVSGGNKGGDGNGGNRFTQFTKENLNPQVDTVTQKFTGRSNLFGGANRFGYTDLRPDGSLKPGYGGRVFGGLLSLLTGIPIVGGAIGSMYDKGKGFFTPKTRDMSEFNKLGLYTGIPPTEEEDDNTTNTPITTGELKDTFLEGAMAKLNKIETREYNTLQTGKDLGLNSPEQNQRLEELEQKKNQESALTNRAFVADGGPIGGEFDFESARQMYGLGKLVKKVTRTVKKIAKSPVGKAAIAAATIKFGGPLAAKFAPGTFGSAAKSPFLRAIGRGQFFGDTGIFSAGKNILFGTDAGIRSTPGLFDKIPGGGVTAAIAGTSLLAGALTPEQEEEAQQIADETGFSIEEARNSILARARDDYKMDFRARGFRAEGGIMRAGYQEGSKEPVAKKTMPLLDMDGQEMDLRAEGGFVPIGRMEKADDVPARLSKNEFVFTADAVRNAGEGDVDKGAEVMYNMMKNLESGGDVSEESQGLDGARKMFQTSQRLEEVL
jgi:hypothetical protein